VTRHLTLEELLALQEGEELGDLARHLDQCPLCALQRRSLERRQEQLRALPVLQPSEDRWPAIRARVVAARRRRTLAARGALAAAVLAFAVAAPAILHHKAPTPAEPLNEMADLVRRSQWLEEKLRALPEPDVLDVGSADAIVQLEDQIALVDQCIGEVGADSESGQELAVLWQTRIALLETLTNLRNPAFAQLLR
jgi:hypothetical protein